MPKITLGHEYFGSNFDPQRLVNELKRHGFKFISEGCPTKFAGKLDQQQHDDGSVTFTQTEELQ
jgi:hypothetical protein